MLLMLVREFMEEGVAVQPGLEAALSLLQLGA